MIKFVVRWLFRLFILLVVFAVALILLKDVLVKGIVENQIRAQSGMDVKIGKLELGLLAPTLSIEDFTLYNPAEFGGSAFLDVPDLHLEYDLAALATGRLHLPLLRLSIREVNIVESRSGQTNLMIALTRVEGLPETRHGRGGSVLGLDFAGIVTLNLSLGTVRSRSLKRLDAATEVNVGLKNQIFTDTKSLAGLSDMIMNAAVRHGITITSEPARAQRLPAPVLHKPKGKPPK